jgi:hypothetical protein
MTYFERIRISQIEDDVTNNLYEIILDQQLYNSWHLHHYDELYLKFGNKKVRVWCQPAQAEKHRLLKCSYTLASELYLPLSPLEMVLTFSPSEKKFELGPIVALLTRIVSATDQPFGHLTPYCEEMARYSKNIGVFFYVFYLQEACTDHYTGYLWHDHSWAKQTVPVPHVIHNRLNTRKLEGTKLFQLLRHYCIEAGIHVFNDHFLDKWEVHEELVQREEVAPYLPEAILLEDMNALEWMLEKHESIFVKPIHGNQGKRIFKIWKEDDVYVLDYSSFNGEKELTFQTFAQIKQMLKNRIKKQYFIIQQGLDLIQLDQRSLDFRVLCNRNYEGIWKIASAFARVSGKEQFVSNIARGGELFKLDDVLTPCFDQKRAKEFKHFLCELALEISGIIGNGMDGIYGELGIDLGIDTTGHPWIIEVNTKPSKNLDQERDGQMIRPSAKGIIDYASYLSQFPYIHKR